MEHILSDMRHGEPNDLSGNQLIHSF